MFTDRVQELLTLCRP